MELRQAFGQVLRDARKLRGVSQESLADVSSRTYVSGLERGLKNPTLDMVDVLADHLTLHPLTLIAAAYLAKQNIHRDELLAILSRELKELRSAPSAQLAVTP